MTSEEITKVQEMIFSRIEEELANGYDNAIHDSYQSRTVLQFAQAINALEIHKRNIDDCGLPWHDV